MEVTRALSGGARAGNLLHDLLVQKLGDEVVSLVLGDHAFIDQIAHQVGHIPLADLAQQRIDLCP
jgi:hypothetical protein